MLFEVLALISVVLTYTMFHSKSVMLGFPCLIFWSIFGGYCYQQSTITWDIYYLVFFGSFGMAIFSAYAAYALRTKKEESEEGDLYFDEGGDNDIRYVDEVDNIRKNTKNDNTDDTDKPRKRMRDLRERADRRRARWS